MKRSRAIRKYLAAAFRDADIVEMRTLGHGSGPAGVRSGLFDNIDLLLAEADTVDQSDVYMTLNRPKPQLVENKLGIDGRTSLHDADIDRIVRIPFDFDPVRPRGENSSDSESMHAEALALTVATALRSVGWPE